jgi:NitT/TauT family transport system substrate-binding protein
MSNPLARLRLSPLALALLVAAAVAVGACGGDSRGAGSPAGSAAPVKLRLGYFPNITHAQPLVGLATGQFARELGEGVTLQPKTFNAGPAVIEALFAGEIDAAYIGPNPAINGYVKSRGEALRIVAGATSGGAALVVRTGAGIEKPADLARKKIASPQLGNTQDVALRTYLQANGLQTKERGGNVTVLPIASPETFSLFQKGDIDGAWVPEPWASRLILQAGGKLFLDERTLWPNGEFVTTNLVVRAGFLRKHPDAVERLLRAHVRVTERINADPDQARQLTNQAIADLSGAALPPAVVEAAWANLRFSYDPLVASLHKSADDAFALGFLGRKRPNLANLYDLRPLDTVLAALGLPEVPR